MRPVVFAYMTQRRRWKIMLLVLSAIPIAMVANAFRLWGTGVLASVYGAQAADGFYHTPLPAGWSLWSPFSSWRPMAVRSLDLARAMRRRGVFHILPHMLCNTYARIGRGQQ